MSEEVKELDYSEPGVNCPLMSCKDCQALVHKDYIHKSGKCQKCGNLRFSQVRVIQEDDMQALKDGTYNLALGEYVIDPNWIALFGEDKEEDGDGK